MSARESLVVPPLTALHERLRPDAPHPPQTTTELLVDLAPVWWGTALLFYGLGDLATTLLGLHLGTIAEAGPLAAAVVTLFGAWTVIPLKIGLFAGFYALWRLIPTPHNVGVPLALATIGILVTNWNAFVLLRALHG